MLNKYFSKRQKSCHVQATPNPSRMGKSRATSRLLLKSKKSPDNCLATNNLPKEAMKSHNGPANVPEMLPMLPAVQQTSSEEQASPVNVNPQKTFPEEEKQSRNGAQNSNEDDLFKSASKCSSRCTVDWIQNRASSRM